MVEIVNASLLHRDSQWAKKNAEKGTFVLSQHSFLISPSIYGYVKLRLFPAVPHLSHFVFLCFLFFFILCQTGLDLIHRI